MNTNENFYPCTPDEQYAAGLITEVERDIANALDAGEMRITEEVETLEDAYNDVSNASLPEQYQHLRGMHMWDQLQAVPGVGESPATQAARDAWRGYREGE